MNIWIGILVLIPLWGCTRQNTDSLRAYIEAKEEYTAGNFSATERLLVPWMEKEDTPPQVIYLLAKTRFMQGRNEETSTLLEKLLKKHPEYGDARLWLARTKLALDAPLEAEAVLKEALQFNSEDPRVLSLMATCQQILGNINTAMDYYKLATIFEDELVRIYLSLAAIYNQHEMASMAEMYTAKAETLVDSSSPFAMAVQMARRNIND